MNMQNISYKQLKIQHRMVNLRKKILVLAKALRAMVRGGEGKKMS